MIMQVHIHDVLSHAACDCVEELVNKSQFHYKNVEIAKNMKKDNTNRDERIKQWKSVVLDAASQGNTFDVINDRLGDVSQADADYLLLLIAEMLDARYVGDIALDPVKAYERAMGILG